MAFVTDATVANASCIAAARDALLAQVGWDVQADGLFGAPELTVVVDERAHSMLSKSLGPAGLGRLRADLLPWPTRAAPTFCRASSGPTRGRRTVTSG